MSDIDLVSAIGGAIAAGVAAGMLTGIAWLLKLLYRTLKRLDLTLLCQAEIKAEIVQLSLHQQEMNNHVAKTRRDVDWLMGSQGRALEQDP